MSSPQVDDENAKDTPNVAIMMGAYEGFDYYYPTLHLQVKAPSGTVFIGQFSDLLHAVGGGTGVRTTTVYCQHEIVARGERVLANGEHQKLVGAKRNKGDIKLGERCAVIKSLMMHKFC